MLKPAIPGVVTGMLVALALAISEAAPMLLLIILGRLITWFARRLGIYVTAMRRDLG